MFSFSRQPKSIITNINLIQINDRDYRTIGVMPFFNFTDNDAYSYVGKTIQRFTTDNLLILNKIKITTNDYIIPVELRTNKLTIFSFGTNLIRNVIILDADEMYKNFLQFPNIDDIPGFASFCHCDYLVYGQYRKYKNSEQEFTVKYKIYNLIQNKDVFEDSLILNIEDIETGVKKLSNSLLNFFKEKKTGTIKIITIYSNSQIVIDNVLVNNSIPQYVVPKGRHSVEVKLLNASLITNIVIQAGNTNSLYFTNRIFNMAILKINSEPTNARVSLNVTTVGYTPLIDTNVVIGPYRLQVEKSNYQTFFKNINIQNGTNDYFINLEKTLSAKEKKEKNIKNKKIMYWSLGLGTVALGIAYYFNTEQQFAQQRLNFSYNSADANRVVQDETYSGVSALVGLGAYTVSFIYFLKVLSYDDVNIGMHKIDNFNFVQRNDNNYLLWQHRF